MSAAQAELLVCLKQVAEADATKAKEELSGKLGLRSVPEFLGYFAILDGEMVTFWK